MNLHSRFWWTKGGWVIALVVLRASSARATEGGLEIFPDPPQLLLLLVIFLALIPPVNRLLLRPLLRVLDERAERIEGARRRAAQVSQDAEERLRRYEAAIRAAKTEAEAQRRALLDASRREQARLTAEARSQAEREIEQARAEVGIALEEARGSLRQAAEGLARDVVERILVRSVA